MRIEHWRYSVPLWLRGLFRRRDVERDLDDEIRDHIDRQTAAYIAGGMSPEDAKCAALVRFGGVERVKDESRDVRRLSAIDSVGQLRYAARSLSRARTFSIATIATIALGVGAGCAVFTLVDAVLLRPLPYPDSDRLVGLWHSFPGIDMPVVRQSPGTYTSYRKLAKSFESIGAYSSDISATVTYPDPTLPPERVPMARVAGAVFAMLRTSPLVGRTFSDADEQSGAPRVVVVGEHFWRTRLEGTPSVVGRRIRIDGDEHEIIGVLPGSFAFPSAEIRLWLPAGAGQPRYLGSFTFQALGRLRPGVSIGTAQQELQQILMRTPETYPEQRPGVSSAQILAHVKAMAVIHPMRDDVIGGFDRILWLVAATVALLVVVSFSNVSSLLLARVEAQRWEFAVRSILGASAARVWWNIAAEAAILALGGGALGYVLAAGGLATLVRIGPPDIPRLHEVRVDGTLVRSVACLTIAFWLVGGAIGMWRVRSMAAVRSLSDGGRFRTASRASQRLRAAFVAAEVALSLVLLAGSAVLGRSVLRLRAVDPGFDARNVVTFWTELPSDYKTEAAVTRFYQAAIDRIGRIPGVESAGIVSKLPLVAGSSQRIIWVDGVSRPDAPLPPAFTVASASDGYFKAMGIPMLAGRSFDRTGVSRGAHEVVVGRRFAMRYWRDSTGRLAIGKRIRPAQDTPSWYTIVGVVGDVRDSSLTAPAEGVLYFPQDTGPDSTSAWRTNWQMAFVVRTRGEVAGLPAVIEREVRSLDRTVPVYQIAPMEQIVASAGSRMTFALLVLAIGAAATLALGVVGLYGVIAYVVSLRTREIGIRIALGLVPGKAARLILAHGEVVIITGALAGVALFLAFAKLLRTLAFEVSVVDPVSLAVAGLMVVVVASIATWIPAMRAARINPADTLKAE